MRIAIDSVSYAAIRAFEWPEKIGYLNGPAAWSTSDIQDCRDRGQLLVLVDMDGTAPDLAGVLAVRDAQGRGNLDPAIVREWVHKRNQWGPNDAVIFAAMGDVPDLITAAGPEPLGLWLSMPSANDAPPPAPPQLPEMPPNMRLTAIQYAIGQGPLRQYNMSVIYDDTWHVPTDAAAVVAAFEATVTESAIVPVGQAAATAAAMRADLFENIPRPAAVTATQSQVNHDYIIGVLADVRRVAGMFRTARASGVATVLENAANHASEVGQLIKLAGL